MKKIILPAVILCILAVILTVFIVPSRFNKSSNAAAGAVELSAIKETVKKEASVTIKVHFHPEKTMQSVTANLHYDDTAFSYKEQKDAALSGSSGVLTIKDSFEKATAEKTYEITFTALKTGSYSFSLSDISYNGYDKLNTVVLDAATCSVTVTENAKQTDDSSLKELLLGVGELSPEWDPQTYQYEVTVPHDTKIFTFSSIPSDKDAVITSDGPDTLKNELSIYKITVTAPSGASSTYTITVKKAAN